ncbi:MAG: hypothetical protein R2695_04095 [Acidimicrobiales bacterium]
MHSVLQVLGLAAIAGGVALIWVPGGVVAAGVALVLIGVAIENDTPEND